MLYDDGENLRLLTMLYEEQVSGYPKVLRENYGVYTTGDNVMMIDHDYKVTAVQPHIFPDHPQHLSPCLCICCDVSKDILVHLAPRAPLRRRFEVKQIPVKW